MKTIDASVFAEVLQTGFDADPAAMHALCINRVPCNSAIIDHPHIVVDVLPSEKLLGCVGLLGILNGILNSVDSPDVIGMKFSDEKDSEGRHKLLGFCVVEKNK